MSSFWPMHDPNSQLDYVVHWPNLNGDTIDTSSFTEVANEDGDLSGITLSAPTHTDTTATVTITGGTEGVTATIVNHIITAGGRVADKTCLLPIGNT